jgi:hypothetical protein
MTQFCMPSYTSLHVVPVQTLQSKFPADSSDSSLPQRTGLLDRNEALFYRGLGPRGLCHKEIMRAGAYPVQVNLPCPLGLLSRWEEMAAAKLPCTLGVAIAELFCSVCGDGSC